MGLPNLQKEGKRGKMRVRHTELFADTNVRPENYNTRDYNKGDCTTRALTYILGGKMSYDEIERRQYALAARLGTRRNTSGTWDIIAKENGFRWVYMFSKKNRGLLARMLKGFTSPVITHSRGHVAVIDGGLVRDNWDSTGGLVDNILVKVEEAESLCSILAAHGIETEYVEKCRVIVKHRHRRWRSYFHW